jgi:general secretion pathway protein I
MKGFTLIEVLIATAIAGLAFGAFVVLATTAAKTADQVAGTVAATVAAHNCLNEAVYLNRSCQGKEEELLNQKVELNQDFQEVMGVRVVKVEGGTPNWGKLVELYEVR